MESTQNQTSARTFHFQTQPQNQNIIQSLQSRISEFSAAFTNADAAAVTSFFTTDATLINPVGERAQGRDAISRVVQKDIQTLLQGGRNEFRFENARILTDDLVLVDMNQYITGLKTPEGSITFHVVVLAKKVSDQWLWLDARPYPLMPMPPTAVH